MRLHSRWCWPRTRQGWRLLSRGTKRQRLIADDKVILVGPRFSQDGQRLLFVRNQASSEDRELVSCETVDLAMPHVLLRTTNTIISPVEIDNDTILYSSSPVTFDPTTRVPNRRLRSDHHDFYLLKAGAPPRRLSDFDLYQIYALNVTPTQVIFSAAGPKPNNLIIPKFEPLAPADSEIFALDFDLSEYRIRHALANAHATICNPRSFQLAVHLRRWAIRRLPEYPFHPRKISPQSGPCAARRNHPEIYRGGGRGVFARCVRGEAIFGERAARRSLSGDGVRSAGCGIPRRA